MPPDLLRRRVHAAYIDNLGSHFVSVDYFTSDVKPDLAMRRMIIGRLLPAPACT